MGNLKIGFGIKRRWSKRKIRVLSYEPAAGSLVLWMVLQSARISWIRARLQRRHNVDPYSTWISGGKSLFTSSSKAWTQAKHSQKSIINLVWFDTAASGTENSYISTSALSWRHLLLWNIFIGCTERIKKSQVCTVDNKLEHRICIW